MIGPIDPSFSSHQVGGPNGANKYPQNTVMPAFQQELIFLGSLISKELPYARSLHSKPLEQMTLSMIKGQLAVLNAFKGEIAGPSGNANTQILSSVNSEVDKLLKQYNTGNPPSTDELATLGNHIYSQSENLVSYQCGSKMPDSLYTVMHNLEDQVNEYVQEFSSQSGGNVDPNVLAAEKMLANQGLQNSVATLNCFARSFSQYFDTSVTKSELADPIFQTIYALNEVFLDQDKIFSGDSLAQRGEMFDKILGGESQRVQDLASGDKNASNNSKVNKDMIFFENHGYFPPSSSEQS